MWVTYFQDHLSLHFKDTDEHYFKGFYINTETNVVRLDLTSEIAYESLFFIDMILIFSKKLNLLETII